MTSPSFGLWPAGSAGGASAVKAFAVVEGPSEPFPNGRFLTNYGGVFDTVVNGGAGQFALTMLDSSITAANTGVLITPWGGTGTGAAAQASYSISGSTLSVVIRDESGTLADPNRFTITLMKDPG